MKKKIFALIMGVVLIVSLAACTGSTKPNPTASNPASASGYSDISYFLISGWGGADYYHGFIIDFANGYFYRNIEPEVIERSIDNPDSIRTDGNMDRKVIKLTDDSAEELMKALKEARVLEWKDDYRWDNAVEDGFHWRMQAMNGETMLNESTGYGVFSECTPKEYEKLEDALIEFAEAN